MRVVLDLPTLGELAGRIATAFAAHKGVEMTEDDDLVVAQATVDALYFMFDRAEFARSVLKDVDGLEASP